MRMMSVQVCSESTGHAESIQRMHDTLQVECGKLMDLLFPSYSSTELAMMSAHRRAAAGDTLCCRSSSCLKALRLINRAESVITHFQPIVESYW